VTTIWASNNNWAETVLNLFKQATARYGIPSRVRGDRGRENIEVATFMIMKNSCHRGSFIWGRYVCFILILFQKKKSLIFMDIAQLKTATLSSYGLKSGLSLPDVGKRFSLDLSVSTCSILMTPSTCHDRVTPGDSARPLVCYRLKSNRDRTPLTLRIHLCSDS